MFYKVYEFIFDHIKENELLPKEDLPIFEKFLKTFATTNDSPVKAFLKNQYMELEFTKDLVLLIKIPSKHILLGIDLVELLVSEIYEVISPLNKQSTKKNLDEFLQFTAILNLPYESNNCDSFEESLLEEFFTRDNMYKICKRKATEAWINPLSVDFLFNEYTKFRIIVYEFHIKDYKMEFYMNSYIDYLRSKGKLDMNGVMHSDIILTKKF